MIVQVLTAHARAVVGVRVVAPTHNARVGNVGGQEIAEPVDTVGSGPCLFSVAVKTMHSDDAGGASDDIQ